MYERKKIRVDIILYVGFLANGENFKVSFTDKHNFNSAAFHMRENVESLEFTDLFQM